MRILKISGIILPLLPSAALAEASLQKISFQPQVRGLSCLKSETRAMITDLISKIGPIQITSTCGGRHARNSQHYRGKAIDFRPLATSPRKAAAVARSLNNIGGVGTYSNGIVHADVGELQHAWYGHKRSRYASASKRSRYAKFARSAN